VSFDISNHGVGSPRAMTATRNGRDVPGTRTMADSNSKKIRVLTADDHPMMRESLGFILEKQSDICLVGEAANGAEAIAKTSELHPDVILMDLQMPEMDGLEAITTIQALHPDIHTIVLTTYPGDARAARALALGAKAYILKSAPISQILYAIRAAASGRSIIDANVAQEIARFRGTESLTAREISILKLVRQGLRNSQIGKVLNISEETVKSRIKSALAKLGARDRTQAVTVAMRRGFLEADCPLGWAGGEGGRLGNQSGLVEKAAASCLGNSSWRHDNKG
jgi:DNA-binding NarL/FixJ family response regulator